MKKSRIWLNVCLSILLSISSTHYLFAKQQESVDSDTVEEETEVLVDKLEEVEEDTDSAQQIMNIQEKSSITYPISIDDTTFPDQYFRDYVKKNIDTDGDTTLTEEECMAVTDMNIKGNPQSIPAVKIKSLEGIEYFPNLESLDCSYQGIRDLTYLSENRELTELYCQSQKPTVSGKMKSLNLENNTKLKIVDASFNDITHLVLPDSSTLEYLDLYNNSFRGYPNLNLTKYTSLRYLNFSNTDISSILLPNTETLEEVSCYSTKLSNIDVSQYTGLTRFSYSSNSSLSWVNIGHLPNIESASANWSPQRTTNITLPNKIGSFNFKTFFGEGMIIENIQEITANGVDITANLNTATGELTGYPKGNNQSIRYVYKCGTYTQNGETFTQTLEVNVNYSTKGDRTLIKTKDLLDRTYGTREHGQPYQLSSYYRYDPSQGKNENIEIQEQWYRIENGTEIPCDPPVNGMAGEYRVKVQVLESELYGASNELIFEHTIHKGTPSVIWQNDYRNSAYTGSSIEAPTYTITPDTLSGVLQWYDSSGTIEIEAPVDAGEYQVKVKITGDNNWSSVISNEKVVQVLKGVNKITEWSNPSLVYPMDTTMEYPIVTGLTFDKNINNITYMYGTSENGPWDVTKPTEAGTYYVQATVPGDGNNYDSITGTKQFTIEKGTSSIMFKDGVLTTPYTGQPVQLTKEHVNIIGSDGEVRFEWYTADDMPLTSAPVNVGSYKVKAILESNANYQEASTYLHTFTITQGDRTLIKMKDLLDRTYGTSEHGQPYELSSYYQYDPGQGNNENVEVQEQWYRVENGTEIPCDPPVNGMAGEYRVKVQVLESELYGASNELIFEHTIHKGTPSVIWQSDYQNPIYTGSSIEAPTYMIAPDTLSGVLQWYDSSGTIEIEVPVDAGEYQVKVKITGDNNWNSVTSNAQVVQVLKGVNKITEWSNPILVYPMDTTMEYPIVTGLTFDKNINNITYMYGTSENGPWDVTKPTEAGTYYVQATVPGDGNNYDSITGTKQFTIEKGTSSIMFKDGVLTTPYTGQPVQLTKEHVNIIGSDGEVRFEWYTADDMPLTSAPVNAGSYKVKAILESNANYQETSTYLHTFTITKAINIWEEVLSISGWTYGEEAKEPSARAKFGNVIFKYSSHENGPFVLDKPDSVGIYWVKAMVEETDNYTGIEDIKQFTIAPVGGDIVILEDLDKEYDGKEVNSTPSYTHTESTGNVLYKWQEKVQGIYIDMPAGEIPTQAGEYQVQVIIEAEGNYDRMESAFRPFVIRQAENSVEISMQGWTYGEEAKDPSATAKFGDIEFLYSNYENESYEAVKPENAGEYWVKARVLETRNWKSAEHKQKFVINQAKGSIRFIDGINITKVYDGEHVAITRDQVIVEDDTDGREVSFSWYQMIGRSYVNLEEAPVEGGGYKVRATVEGNQNYEEAIAEHTFDITQANNVWEETLSINGWAYGEEASEPTARAKYGNIVYNYSGDGVTYTEVKPNNPGVYYVKAKVEETESYQGLEDIRTFIIEKGILEDSIVGNINSMDKEYDGKPVYVPNEIEDLIGQGYDVSCTYFQTVENMWMELQQAPSEVGQYKLVVSIYKENYIPLEKEYYFEIRDRQEEIIEGDSSLQTPGVNTGDTSQVGLWLLSLLLGFYAITIVYKKR